MKSKPMVLTLSNPHSLIDFSKKCLRLDNKKNIELSSSELSRSSRVLAGLHAGFLSLLALIILTDYGKLLTFILFVIPCFKIIRELKIPSSFSTKSEIGYLGYICAILIFSGHSVFGTFGIFFIFSFFLFFFGYRLNMNSSPTSLSGPIEQDESCTVLLKAAEDELCKAPLWFEDDLQLYKNNIPIEQSKKQQAELEELQNMLREIESQHQDRLSHQCSFNDEHTSIELKKLKNRLHVLASKIQIKAEQLHRSDLELQRELTTLKELRLIYGTDSSLV